MTPVVSDSEDRHKEGTTAIYVFTLIVPIIFTTIFAVLLNVHSRHPSIIRKFGTEFIVLVYSIVFNVTILSDYIPEVLAVFVLIAIPLLLIHVRQWIRGSGDVEQQDVADCGDNGEEQSRLLAMKSALKRAGMKLASIEIPISQPGYVTMLRSTINLITAVCILAVDFKVFPGYSFKTHRFGFSLMDTGIGLFIIAIGIVSNKPPLGYFKSMKNLLRLVWNIFPFIVLGVGRAIIIKQIDYSQSVTEYGRHWNAFLTLGVAKLFATLIASCMPREQHLVWAGIVILAAHEIALQYGLADFVMDRKTGRENLFKANREGIVSIAGFVALQLFSMYIGYLLRTRSKESITVREFLAKILAFAIMAIAFWATVYQADSLLGISRRICNLGYVVWILCILASMVVLYMLVELFAGIVAQHKGKDRNWSYVPLIMQAINYNGLTFFLMANVLTGMVNMTFDTGRMDTLHSLFILMSYMLVNCLIITVLYVRKIRIKFW